MPLNFHVLLELVDVRANRANKDVRANRAIKCSPSSKKCGGAAGASEKNVAFDVGMFDKKKIGHVGQKENRASSGICF